MSLEGMALGVALAEANANVVRPTMELRGVVFGESASEVAEKANAEAFAFFNGLGRYDLDVSTERYTPLFLTKRKKGDPLPPTYRGEFWARLVA